MSAKYPFGDDSISTTTGTSLNKHMIIISYNSKVSFREYGYLDQYFSFISVFMASNWV